MTLFWSLRYDERGLPLTDVVIDGKMHTLMLDTGSSTEITIFPGTFSGSVISKTGNLYEGIVSGRVM
ncbi:hypothetical protein G3142_004618 [Salmonella enterica subsp. enterica serovar Montevideo]|nr:hypothetical protein [Salmonella enterica subsp. enterica serovar Montevideo]EEK7814275.1 hypothetical protein [Salmonella enterica subsp. enterica serovar Montevideo]